jgi:hypothetical protein
MTGKLHTHWSPVQQGGGGARVVSAARPRLETKGRGVPRLSLDRGGVGRVGEWGNTSCAAAERIPRSRGRDTLSISTRSVAVSLPWVLRAMYRVLVAIQTRCRRIEIPAIAASVSHALRLTTLAPCTQGRLTPLNSTPVGPNPAFIIRHPTLPNLLYATTECILGDGELLTLELNREQGRLEVLGFGTGRQRMVLERWTFPKLAPRTCTCEFGKQSCIAQGAYRVVERGVHEPPGAGSVLRGGRRAAGPCVAFLCHVVRTPRSLRHSLHHLAGQPRCPRLNTAATPSAARWTSL